MSSKNYPWKRFWCPREEDFSLADGGYLLDPESAPRYLATAVPYDQISRFPCLILLGEPGIGKSSALVAEGNRIQEDLEARSEPLLWKDLKAFSTDVLLVREIFESEEFEAWRRGSHSLHLFLDSLDECRLHVPTVATLLRSKLEGVRAHIGRLRLRVACRTAHWSEALGEGLEDLWGKDQVGAYKLAPLRRRDVELAAEISNTKPAEFLAEVEERRAQPFATKPVTLRFLLKIWQEKGQLPTRQTELYSQGCEQLAAEHREPQRNVRRLEPKKRLAVVTRMAAGLIFCNRTALFKGVDLGEVGEDELRLVELSGGKEAVGLSSFEVNESELLEVLDSGLFTGLGPNRFGFAHQTYAEFLAAKYLIDHGLGTQQILSLLRHPEETTGAIVPQLAETAAWVATMNTEVFEEILRADPQVLLRSNVELASEDDRAKLVERLLALFAREELLDSDLKSRDGYRRLDHPGLAEQLRPYLEGPASAWLVRRVAIQIAAACRLSSLEGDLVKIALDAADSSTTRVQAARAVAGMGSEQTRKKLLPLALGQAGDDPDDELKGHTLRALWPEYMTAEQLFVALSPPKREDFFGAYHWFLDGEDQLKLRPPDLPTGLRWVAQLPTETNPGFSFQRLADRLVVLGQRFYNFSEVQVPLIEAMMARSVATGSSVTDPDRSLESQVLFNDQNRRRLLLSVSIGRFWSDERIRHLIAWSDPPMARPEDLPWVIDQLKAEGGPEVAMLWAWLASQIFQEGLAEHSEIILREAEVSKVLAEVFRRRLGWVDLESEIAEKSRADFARRKQPQERAKRLSSSSSYARQVAQVTQWLDKIEAGDLDGWWRFLKEIALRPHSKRSETGRFPSLDELPEWLEADGETKARLIQAAIFYLRNREANLEEWCGTNIVFFPAEAGYDALCLLARQSLPSLDALPLEVWQRWTPIILGHRLPRSEYSEGAPHHELVARAYLQAPGHFLQVLSDLIDSSCERDEHSSVFPRLEQCWDAQLTNMMLRKVKAPSLGPRCLRQLLEVLLSRGCEGANSFARELLLRRPVPTADLERKRLVATAVALISQAPDAGWPAVWPLFELDPGIGVELLDEIVTSHDMEWLLLRKLNEIELANLYLWLTAHYPHREDPDLEGDQMVDQRGALGIFRDRTLENLCHRGTPAGVRELARVVELVPDVPSLKFVLLQARQTMRRNTWSPPRPEDVLALARRKDGRLVRNGDELLEALIESLGRLEKKLQGKPPAAPDLWDRDRPKEESYLSDYVKRHFDDDLAKVGLIAFREVEIQRGEKTDIHVAVSVPAPEHGSWEKIQCIIEVKGSWHKDLKTAMKSQLVDRYLLRNSCRHGLYLVGWFRCSAWDSMDSRFKKHLKWSLAEAAKELDGQATGLSSGDVRIRSLVLDATLQDKPQPRKSKRRPGLS